MKIPQLMRDRYSLIREVVQACIGPKPYLAERKRMAAFLYALADELSEPRPPGPGNSAPGEGIRWNGRHLTLGRALWQAIGEPSRVSAEVKGTTTRLRSAQDGELHVVVNPQGSIHIWCHALWEHAQWAEGWRPGRIVRDVIVFDAEAAKP